MVDVIYCHQCGKDNRPERKFCRSCQSPLLLVGKHGDPSHTCAQCSQANPSFARFCKRCSTPLMSTSSKRPAPEIPFALINKQATGGNHCPACGGQARLVSQYSQDIRTDNANRRVTVGTTEALLGAQVIVPKGMKEPRLGWLSRNLKLLTTFVSGCLFTLLLLGVIPILLPMLRNNVLLEGLLAAGTGFFLSSRLNRSLLLPYLSQLERARARWRRARICPRCDAVFISDETIYTSPDFLDRLVWTVPQQS